MKRQIPNIITLCNLLCGTVAIYWAVLGHTARAAEFIMLGIFFDFFDGMFARLLKVASPIGKELDSLADVITSGVAPGLILFHILSGYPAWNGLRFVALLMPAFSAYRLAKFNLDERQSHSFIGLPTPANAIIWAMLGIGFEYPEIAQIALIPLPDIFCLSQNFIELPLLAVVSILLDILLISELPLFALKFKNLLWKENRVRFCFLISCFLLVAILGIYGLVVAILWYIVLSLITKPRTSSHE